MGAGWAYILFEIFAGEAGKESEALGGHVKTAFDIMKFIVTIGWSIYPLGYFFGYLQSGVDDSTLNLVYNLADFVNKIALPRHLELRQKRHRRQGLRQIMRL